MFSSNHVYMGGAIRTTYDLSALLNGYDILDSFYEQYEVDLAYTVLPVYPFIFV